MNQDIELVAAILKERQDELRDELEAEMALQSGGLRLNSLKGKLILSALGLAFLAAAIAVSLRFLT